ncbi:alpha-L-fucosidase [Gracilibacillus salitolerans]|uniref:alpha-L-fucosidase n=1 Tax=Gracilibacillus salitolerans TaxID=2663022 RepID=A0A5Q2TMD4_9BACI|nr:alpha-L-fucosidase [Gracilibacillus salitolerans]QGH36119.1 alpha-L-fucosidase [Gracilibacillus salitolerans]
MDNNELAFPSKQQLAWQNLELGFFVHFGINTFCNQEWGDGTDSPEKFNPTELDAKQWVRLAKKTGFQYLILTAKHHDGFCLWQTETTNYSVKSSPWKQGNGDVVKECAAACAEFNMPFGIYLSPWDRHEPCYNNKEAYDEFYCQQLTELLTNYGPIVEVWFDGAGSENREYDWESIIGIVKKHQPDAMIFNMGQPTVRWVGNEDGVASYPCWNTRETDAKISMFTDQEANWLPGTPKWLPAECDVPLRGEHWFWHPNDEHNIRSIENLLDIYYRSVGHGANLLLNVTPDSRGIIPEADSKRLLEFATIIQDRFSTPVARTEGEASEIVLDLIDEKEVDTIVLKEDIAHGERVKQYLIESWKGNKWKQIGEGMAIGHKRIQQIESITTKKLRLRVIESHYDPKIIEFSCFNTKS